MSKTLEDKIRKQWDIPALLSDLRKAKWGETEPGRIDRRTWVGSYKEVENLARQVTSDKEWEEAEREGFEHEIVDEYMEALSAVVMDAMGKELRREHVYATFEDGEGFIGQYEDMSAKELKEMGFEVEG